MEQLREVETARLPVFDGAILIELIALTDHFVEVAEAELSHDLADFFSDEDLGKPRKRIQGNPAARRSKSNGYDSGEIWRLIAGKDRAAYSNDDEYDSDDMEAGADDLMREGF